MPSQPLAEQGAAPQPSPDQMPFAAGLGGAQEGDISAQTLFLPLEGVAGSCLSLPQQQGLGWALQLSTAKSFMDDFRSSLQVSKEWGAGLQTICCPCRAKSFSLCLAARAGSDWGYSCAEHVGRCFSRLLPLYSSWSYTEFGE